MKYIILLPGLLLTGILWSSCNNDQQPTEPSTPAREIQEDPVNEQPATDYLILPGKQVGAILPDASESALKKIYGNTQVKTETRDAGEGTLLPTTLIFPEDANEAAIIWKDAAGLKNPERISIRGTQSNWTIDNKIRMGTSLQNLEQLNKKPFSITGCCFDAPYTIVDWNGGELNYMKESGIILRLRPENESAALKKKIIGDKSYPVTDSLIQNAGMKVSEMIIRFPGD
ncbi:MAG TPA: hypothetical protein VFX58_18550 [Chitinophagaceae bacterium]|nr:hypothetical protein [Chitinophagaceae bacterium]